MQQLYQNKEITIFLKKQQKEITTWNQIQSKEKNGVPKTYFP
jgi:hypothetical protein